MGAAEIAALLLSAAGEAAKLLADAIAAEKAGEDTKALELLDQAIETMRGKVLAADAGLDAARERVLKRIEDKFGGGT